MAIRFPQRVGSGNMDKAWAILQNNLDYLADLYDKFTSVNAKGFATVTNGNTTVAVSFGGNITSPAVTITPTADPGGRYWITGRTAAGFTINLSVAAPVAGVGFDWIAKGVS